MSMRLEMLQVARLAPRLLGESTDLVRQFLLRQQNEDGGFRGRDGTSDIYYTVFGLDGLAALQAEHDVPRAVGYLLSFEDGAGLDFVHLCCLARAWAAVSSTESVSDSVARRILGRIEEFRCEDGGYHPGEGGAEGTAYGAFLGFGAYQDLRRELPFPLRLAQAMKHLETPDNAWANDRKVKAGSTNATAAAVTLLRNLGMPINPRVGDWLLQRLHIQGGFVAAAAAPMPDLLSTATTLHALSGLGRDLSPLRELCLDFVDSLWTNEGAFHGQWTDDQVDCEYTFYGLLALGHLSLP